MTTNNEPGVSVYFESTGLTLPLSRTDGQVMRRGQTLVVTPELRALATDRLGNCVYDLTPDEQLKRYGKVMFRVGEPPADLKPYERGSFEEDDARAAALRAAALLPTAEAQRIAAARARAEFGSSSDASSRTILEYTR